MNRIQTVAEDVIRASVAEVVEGIIYSSLSDNARFMESQVHQYTRMDETYLVVRVRFGNKAGIYTTTDLSKDGILEAVKKAEEIALFAKEDPYLPEPEKDKILEFSDVDLAVSELGPEEKSRFLKRIFTEFDDFYFYGVLRSSTNHIHFFNNYGLRGNLSYTTLHLTLLTEDREDGDTFWTAYSFPKLESLSYDLVREKLSSFVRMEYPDAGIKPGKYTVLLSPYAISEVLGFMQYVGFSAKALHEGISFLENLKGKKVFHQSFTLEDRPLRNKWFRMPFDLEGVEKRNLKIFENGVFKHFIYDKRHGKIYRRKSTGHAVDLIHSYPMAQHLEMPEGDKMLSDLVAESEDIILINRFHYVNILDPKSFTLTGMTRDGTFRVKSGKNWKRLPNLRFQVNFMELFNQITGISKEREFVGFQESYGMDMPSGYVLPYMRCEGFNIIGVSADTE